MAIVVGSLAKDTTTTPPDVVQTITNPLSGVAPKSIVFFAVPETTENAQQNADAGICIGFSDGTNERSIMGSSEDDIPASDTRRRNNTLKGISFYDPTDGTLLAEGDVTFSGNNVVITWTENNAVGYIIKYFVSSLGCEVGSFTGTSGTDTIPTTNVGKALMVVSVGSATENSDITSLIMSVGFATASGGGEEGCQAVASQNGVAASNTWRRIESSEFIQVLNPTTGAVLSEANFGGFNSGPNGFDVVWGVTDSGRKFYYIMWYEGDWEAGTDLTKTSLGTEPTTTTIEPDAVFIVGSGNTALGSSAVHNAIGFGVSDGSTEASVAIGDSDNSPDMNTKRNVYDSDCLLVSGVGAQTQPPNRARVSGFNATDFTLDYQNTSAAARYFVWLVVKDATSGSFTAVIADSITVTPIIIRKLDALRSLTETSTITGTPARILTALRSLTESTTITDSASAILVTIRAMAETITITPVITRIQSLFKSMTETTTISEILTGIKATGGKVANIVESITLSDTVSRLTTAFRTMTETINISEILAGITEAVRIYFIDFTSRIVRSISFKSRRRTDE